MSELYLYKDKYNLLNQKLYILSLENNSFLWLPPKTGSSTVSWIFGHFDFWWYKYDETFSDYKLLMNDLAHYGHDCFLPPNHEKMNFISTMRNPYDRMVSYFLMTYLEWEDNPTSEDFELFLENDFLKNKNSVMYKSSKIFHGRYPDYVIRLENLYEDLTKIPFIKDSKLNSTGILQEMCTKKIKKSFDIENREKLLTESSKEKIYNHFKNDFEKFGYPK